MESMNRVLSGSSKNEGFKDVIILLFGLIVDNLNSTLEKLSPESPKEKAVEITKEFSDEDIQNSELMEKIDLQWLFLRIQRFVEDLR